MKYIATIVFDSPHKTKRTLAVLDGVLEDAEFENRLWNGTVESLQKATKEKKSKKER